VSLRLAARVTCAVLLLTAAAAKLASVQADVALPRAFAVAEIVLALSLLRRESARTVALVISSLFAGAGAVKIMALGTRSTATACRCFGDVQLGEGTDDVPPNPVRA
jgi:hypothetical protein